MGGGGSVLFGSEAQVTVDSLVGNPAEDSRRASVASQILRCVDSEDLGTTAGKKALWTFLSPLGNHWKNEFSTLRNDYQAQGLKIGLANRLAALDVVKALRGEDVAIEVAEDGAMVPVVSSSVVGACTPVVGAARPAGARRSRQSQFDRLMAAVQGSADLSAVGIGRSVAWVSANLRTKFERIEAVDVPGPEALALLLWAQENETEYRKLYDCKRIPTRGIAADEEKGFIDSGDPIEDIISRIAQGVRRQTDVVSVRHLQEGESDGSDRERAGGLHASLPGGDVEGGRSADPGRGPGQGGGDNASAGGGNQATDGPGDAFA